MFSPDFAQRLTELETAWLKPRLFKLGQAPNLLLSSLPSPDYADVNLRLTRHREWLGPLRAGLYSLPFADQSFGTVLLQHVMEWSGAERSLLDECIRLVEPGGRLLMVGFNPYAWSRWYRIRKGFAQRARLRSWSYWRRALQQQGFDSAAPQFLAWPESRFEAQLPQRMHTIYLLSAMRQHSQNRLIGKIENISVPMAYTDYVARVASKDQSHAP